MKSIIVDERISRECKRSLEKHGFNIILLPPCDGLPEGIKSHPDSVIFKDKNRIFTYASYAERGLEVFSDIREYHRDISISFVSEEPGKRYPEDTHLNALRIGNRLFSRIDSLSETVKKYAADSLLTLINTKQGYPACTTLAFGVFAVTADKGMARVLSDSGISVLLISEGGIALPPYEYGFIGGASFVFENRVYFFGDVLSHPDGEKIVEFIEKNGYFALSLSEGGLVDLGGAVILE